MEVLSSCRDFYYLHRREVHRYGLATLFVLVALAKGAFLLAFLCMVSIPVMYAYDRWGEPWRLRGEALLKRKK